MRAILLSALVVCAACQPPPGTGVTVVNQVPTGSVAAPVQPLGPSGLRAAGVSPNQTSQVVRAGMPQAAPTPTNDSQAALLRNVDPNAPRATGEPAYAPFDVGAAGTLAPQPTQEAPIFQSLRQRGQ